jgi:hypothetical protein
MRSLLTQLFLLSSALLSAQADTTIYAAQKRVETVEYVFSVPDQWKNILPVDVSTKDRKYDFTDVALPHFVNKTPLTAIFTLRRYASENTNAAEDYILSEITSYPDRITPPGYNYERDSMNILSGEKAILFSTHFYRRSKVSNFTRYDMIVYSKKRKTAYMLTATYQYKDSTYTTEKDFKFREYATRVFKTLLLR